jgi:hypothetical protein
MQRQTGNKRSTPEARLPDPKREYRAPRLVVYGDLDKLTRGGGGGGNDGAAMTMA